jgi:hypothetical protein
MWGQGETMGKKEQNEFWVRRAMELTQEKEGE